MSPVIRVTEHEGVFRILADFSMLPEPDAESVIVEFAQQGIVLTHGSIERYVPIPTDAETEWTSIRREGAVVRISVPTTGLGHRWRAIAMW